MRTKNLLSRYILNPAAAVGLTLSVGLVAQPLQANTLSDDTKVFTEMMSSLAGHLEAGSLNMDALLEDEVLAAMEGEGFDEQAVEKSLDASNGSYRHLSGVKECSGVGFRDLGKRICDRLSRKHHQNLRIDYAIELDPTYSTGTTISEYLGGNASTSAGKIDQLQFRFFFTHPRINAEGRYYMELRVRVLDLVGRYVDGSLKQEFDDYVVGDGKSTSEGVAGVAAGFSVHDFVMPRTWELDESWRDREKLPLKYFATTGALADIEFTLAGGGDVQSHHRVESNSTPVVPLFSGGAAIDIPLSYRIKKIVDSSAGGDIAGEVGVGAGITASYDLDRMGRETGWSTGTSLTTVLATEAAGAGAFDFLGNYSGLNEAGLADGLDYVSMNNVEIITGGLFGDILYSAIWKKAFNDSDAVQIGSGWFAWVAGRAGGGFSKNPSGLPGKLRGVLGDDYSVDLPLRLRMQMNWDLRYNEWYGSAPTKNRLSDNGVFKLKAPGSGGQCVENYASGAVRTESCGMPSSGHTYLASAVGNPKEKVFKLHSTQDLSECLSPGAVNGLIPFGAYLSIGPCRGDTSDGVEPQLPLWKAMNVGGDRVVLSSVFDKSFCLGLGSSGVLEMTSCDAAYSEIAFKLATEDQLFLADGKTVNLRVGDDYCAGLAKNAFQYSPFIVDACNGSDGQKFQIGAASEGYSTIEVQNQNLFIDVDRSHGSNGDAPIHAYPYTEGVSEKWRALRRVDGTINIQARFSNSCLAVDRNSEKTRLLTQETCDLGSDDQRFSVIPEDFNRHKYDQGESMRLAFAGATQNSTYQNNVALAGPQKAIDGRTGGRWNGSDNSLTHTYVGIAGVWTGDLGSLAGVDSVTLYNRVDCCADRLQDFYIAVSDADTTGITDLNELQGVANDIIHVTEQVPGTADLNHATYFFDRRVRGRYITVFKEGNNVLTLAEVTAQGDRYNQLEFAWVWQNGAYAPYADADKAVDGNTYGAYQTNDSNSVTHSDSVSDSVWNGRFDQSEQIGAVKLFNRQEVPERLNNFYIVLSDAAFDEADPVQSLANANEYIEVTTQVPQFGGQLFEFSEAAKGRFLAIYMPSGYLSLAEVEVFKK